MTQHTSVAGAGFDKWQRNCGGEVRTCPGETRQRVYSLSRACKLCVTRMVKILRTGRWSTEGFFSVNFHAEGGPRPERSIKFQRRNVETREPTLTLLKSCLIRRKSGWENRLIETPSNAAFFHRFRKLRFVHLQLEFCFFLFFFIFLRGTERGGERRDSNERGSDIFFKLFQRDKILNVHFVVVQFTIIIFYEAGTFFERKRSFKKCRKFCEKIL